VFGGTDRPGQYVVLIKWYPGYMSAPHAYVTDRLCFVLSGTWWVNSGENFEPDATVPVRAGGFVRRVAHTPHYDGVKKDDKEPAVIGIFGEAPINVTWLDPIKPLVRTGIGVRCSGFGGTAGLTSAAPLCCGAVSRYEALRQLYPTYLYRLRQSRIVLL